MEWLPFPQPSCIVLVRRNPKPVISIEGGRAAENGFASFTLRLSESSLDAVSVDFAIFGRTADRGFDLYNSTYPQFGTVIFEPGETVKTVTIRIKPDYAPETDESFFLELRNPVGASFDGGNAALSAVGWALDDDPPSDDRALAVSNPVVRGRRNRDPHRQPVGSLRHRPQLPLSDA
ncbi:Calx-beta domain-containing protein [Paracoccus sp. (in: a-proteobacteria)]|uniref:Calx-beta domain-containing protein n=1 Tax=Paracoccus sp. TaxID=267 RepID=UPI003220A0DD